MAHLKRASATLALVLLASAAQAATRCPAMFLDGQPPALVAEALRPRTTELCYSRFAVLDSGQTRTPLWSAEHLTADAVAGARGMEREEQFHVDPYLPEADRSELSDYRRSGYDRGHMSPNGDMPDAQSQTESFTLANMIPQDADNNRNLWASIESAVRYLATRERDVYVVTGPMFVGSSVMSLQGRVLVPTDIFKAVYDPVRKAAAAYVTPNAPGQAWKVVSIAELRRMSGIDPFPSLPEQVKATAMDLPEPRLRAQGRSDAHPAEPKGFARGLMGLLTGR